MKRTNPERFAIPVAVTIVCDTFRSLVDRNWPKKSENKRRKNAKQLVNDSVNSRNREGRNSSNRTRNNWNCLGNWEGKPKKNQNVRRICHLASLCLSVSHTFSLAVYAIHLAASDFTNLAEIEDSIKFLAKRVERAQISLGLATAEDFVLSDKQRWPLLFRDESSLTEAELQER